MLNKKSIGVALACALALGAWSGTTLATPVNVGGVLIDPSSLFDLGFASAAFREATVSEVGNVLTGYGLIGTINDNTNPASFCPGCNLTFTFAYTVKAIDTSGANPRVVFDNGSINFYVDHTSSFNVGHPDSASLGSLWLSLGGHAAPYTGFTDMPTGELYSSVLGTVSNPDSQAQSSGYGLLDVTGGPAAYFTDTNTQADGADFTLSSSFLTAIVKGCTSTPSADPSSICHYPISGTGNLIGSSKVSVPEPGPAGILGVGLAVLGLLLGRRRKEAAGRA